MDRMQAPPRNAFFGLLSDLASGTVGYMQDPRRTQQMQGLGAMLESTRIPSLLEGLSYGDSMTTGSGMTMRPNEDVRGLIELATAFAPAGKPAAAAAKAGTMALGRAGERMAERVVPQVMERGGLPAEMLSAMAQGTQSPATVWHGSPHLFQRFDASKMGTGEGAQAYGQGLYLAEARDVGKSYAPRDLAFEQKLMGAYKNAERSGDYASLQVLEEFMTHRTPSEVQETLSQFSGKDAANAKRTFDMASKAFQNQKGSYLYQVDLPDEQIAKMLDYDKPLSKQPPAVQAWLRSPYNPYRNQLTAKDIGGNEPTGAMILGQLQELMSEGKKNDVFTNAANFGAANASRELMEAGIPGIRYLDEGSRGAGKGTSNFVVFPGMEDMLRIEQINEQPIESLLQSLGR